MTLSTQRTSQQAHSGWTSREEGDQQNAEGRAVVDRLHGAPENAHHVRSGALTRSPIGDSRDSLTLVGTLL
jgi:hypothetical protein